MSVIGAFGLVEDGITELMGQLKIDGITVKRLYNAMWVFTKNRLKFLKPLGWGEYFVAESFITSYSLVKLNIETAIKNSDGEIAAYAKTELCALDLQTGRIRKTSSVGMDESFTKHPSLLECGFGKWNGDNLPVIDSVKVRSTNLDFSLHTNNVEYVRFLMNTYLVQDIIKRPVKEIEICYVSQSYENDELQIHKLTDIDKDILAITHNGNTVIKCEILR